MRRARCAQRSSRWRSGSVDVRTVQLPDLGCPAAVARKVYGASEMRGCPPSDSRRGWCLHRS